MTAFLLNGCSSKKESEARARQLLNQARDAMIENDDRKLALQLIEQSIEANPLPEAYSLRASIYLLNRDYRNAMENVQRGLALDSENKRLLELKASIRQRLASSGGGRGSSGSSSLPGGRPTLKDVHDAHRRTNDLIERVRRERERNRAKPVEPAKKAGPVQPAKQPVRAAPAPRR